jgi:acetoacetyl-CoA synthetase
MTDFLWAPQAERIDKTLLKHFIEAINKRYGTTFSDYDALWQWSVDEPKKFWQNVWDFCGVIGDPSTIILRKSSDLSASEFFPEASLNYAENLLRNNFLSNSPEGGTEPALIFHDEKGNRRQLSWNELRDQVSRLQQALRDLGVKRGDRIAGYLPNIPETVAAMLATTSLGAVWSSCSPDFGLSGVSDRFGQIAPKVLFTADGYHYNGKTFDSLTTVTQLVDQIPSIDAVIVIPFVQTQRDIKAVGPKANLLNDICAKYRAKKLEFEKTSFRDPLFIMFSSGTTGLPKCIIHSVGGTLLQHCKEHQLQNDMQSGDRLFYFTTCGWMMWNWLVSALASGVTLILFDGAPTYPNGYRLADIIEAENVTHFGTSAKYIDSCAKLNISPIDRYSFSTLRTILSTGSPLSEDGFRYIYQNWKSDVCLSSIAGGTDILGCFVGGNPIGPVYAGQCQKRQLGMNVRVFSEDGKAIENEFGELVCISPHPSMPLGFLNDPIQQRYREAYFAKFENVWRHGDWVALTAEGGMIFQGRSDATLNPGGVRIGTAEIYRQVQNIEEVLESLVIGQEWENDVRVVLFVKLREGIQLTADLIQRIKHEIRTHASPRHVPAKIIAVPDIPRTRSGKITELAVRDIVHGKAVKNIEALANPEVLEYFRNIKELNI